MYFFSSSSFSFSVPAFEVKALLVGRLNLRLGPKRDPKPEPVSLSCLAKRERERERERERDHVKNSLQMPL